MNKSEISILGIVKEWNSDVDIQRE
jgi:hypothetical protein